MKNKKDVLNIQAMLTMYGKWLHCMDARLIFDQEKTENRRFKK